MKLPLPGDWNDLLADEIAKPYFRRLREFVAGERQVHVVYPPQDDVFNALRQTPFSQVRVLILGQDPYHDEGQAHGLCFSVLPGVKPPPSLMNIFKELRDDLGYHIPNNGCLVPWARQGVLLLNAVLTVRAHAPNSHKGKGWETFTDAIIRKVSKRPAPVVFVLWGGYAGKKLELIDAARHSVVQSPHPSPLSAYQGFFGSKPFSAINRRLRETGQPEIVWQIPDVGPAFTSH